MIKKFKIGVDEAGRGPWAGPVVACALVFLNIKNIDKLFLSKIKDSKKLSKKQREMIFDELIRLSGLGLLAFEIGVIDNYIIDEVGIKESTRLAMERAILGLERKLGIELYNGSSNTRFNTEHGTSDGRFNTEHGTSDGRFNTEHGTSDGRFNTEHGTSDCNTRFNTEHGTSDWFNLQNGTNRKQQQQVQFTKLNQQQSDDGTNSVSGFRIKSGLTNYKSEMTRKNPECPFKLQGNKLSVFIDGNDNFKFSKLGVKPDFIVHGDEEIIEISAASIIAKVHRDNLMGVYSSIYPNIGFERHSGYGTRAHIEALNGVHNLTNIHRISYKPISNILNKKDKLFIHACCGPDIIPAIQDLKDNFDIMFFWYDPNIHPKREYNKRLKEFRKICEKEGIDFIEGEYKISHFFEKVKGLEDEPECGARCLVCYDFRMEKSAIEAKKLGFDYWTTTLNASPKKSFKKLSIIGKKLEEKYGINYLAIDLKKKDGALRSIKYCKENNIYRQNYCGCKFSLPKK